ncbi:MAG: PIN domain-containing protein [Pseudomonadota bacterium]
MTGIQNYVLIDFENLQPANASVLVGHGFKVLVFVGERQTKVPYDLANALQKLGTDAEYIKIGGQGSNALDFHIAFYIGTLVRDETKRYFHIISKDKGFDPLIKHLKGLGVWVQRHSDISTIPILKLINSTSLTERLEAVVEFLSSRGNSKPRKLKTLTNSVRSLFMRRLDEKELEELMEELERRKLISMSKEGAVSYHLEKLTRG